MESQIDVEAITDDITEGGKETKYDGIKVVEPFATFLGFIEDTIVDSCTKSYRNVRFVIRGTDQVVFEMTNNKTTLIRNINPNNQRQSFYFTYNTKITSYNYQTVADLRPIRWYIAFMNSQGGDLEVVEVDTCHNSYGVEVACNDDGRQVNKQEKLPEIGWFNEFCLRGKLEWRFTSGKIRRC